MRIRVVGIDPERRRLFPSTWAAIRFNHNYIGTEHLLLGLMRER